MNLEVILFVVSRRGALHVSTGPAGKDLTLSTDGEHVLAAVWPLCHVLYVKMWTALWL